MKESRDLYLIEALKDGEIKDPAEEKRLRESVESNPELKFEFFIQSSIKNLVSGRLKISPAPVNVRKRLERKLSPGYRSKLSPGLLPGFYSTRPLMAWGTTVVLIIALALIIINRPPMPEYKNFAEEQSGATNMYIMAKDNFENILDGKLSLQIMSGPEQIMAFFTSQGVKYPAYVPVIKDWKLTGALVSDIQGEKYAHHLYSTSDGKLVYLLQVNETELTEQGYLTLTNDLISYLEAGNCFKSTEEDRVTLFTKVKGNIIAVVSNGSPEEIENHFCKLN